MENDTFETNFQMGIGEIKENGGEGEFKCDFKKFIITFIYLLFIYSHVHTLFGSFLPPAHTSTPSP
jgi:hypothetical protein